jgi:hypothetical protein
VSLTAGDILIGPGGVRTTLIDTAGRTWGNEELLGYLNEALRATAFVKPDMYTVQDYIPLIAGNLQQLPEDGIALMQLSENEDGRIITQSDFDLLQESNRFWPRGTRETTVENYAADPRNPRRFIVSPPNNGSGSARALYGAVPPRIAYMEEALPVPDSYESPLKNFVLAKCYAKNSNRQDLAKTNGYMGQWGQALGLKSQAQIAVAPKVASQPGTAA